MGTVPHYVWNHLPRADNRHRSMVLIRAGGQSWLDCLALEIVFEEVLKPQDGIRYSWLNKGEQRLECAHRCDGVAKALTLKS